MRTLLPLLLVFLFVSPTFSQTLTEEETQKLSVLLDSVILPGLFLGPQGETLTFEKVDTFVWTSEQKYGVVYVGAVLSDLLPYIEGPCIVILWTAKMKLNSTIYLPVVAIKKERLVLQKASYRW